jgi:hypothetical protein
MRPDELENYACICASALARAHARSGDRHALPGIWVARKSSTFAVGDFALAYAGQVLADYEALLDSRRRGASVAGAIGDGPTP